jgi:hypothetical protein
MVMILASSVKLAADSYIVHASKERQPLILKISSWFDLVSTILFTAEMLIKIIVMGFIMEPGSYLRDDWNRLDFTIVTVSLVD